MAGSEVDRAAIWYLVGDPGWDPKEQGDPCRRLHRLRQGRHLVHLVLLVVDVVVRFQRSRRPLKVWKKVSVVKVLLV